MSGALGRHVEHDERSRAYPALRAVQVTTVLHRRHCRPYDQGHLGSCTGNAMAGLLMTAPFWQHGRRLGERQAVALYELATTLDNVAGSYPPDDTGSSGLAVAKAARQRGWCTAYHHAFGLEHALESLTLRPVICGVNWYDSFDQPAPDGLCDLPAGAQVRGGHEVCLLGVDVERRQVRGVNSWGVDWGDKGYFSWTWDTFERLLHEHGDVTTVVP